MTSQPLPEPGLPVTLVTAAGCHYCDDAQATLNGLVRAGATLALETVDATSERGRALLTTHRPPMSPLVLVDGYYFSAGRLPRRKLEALLRNRQAIGASRG
ncbi:MAG: glutaredoxin [Micropruina sp.]|nr:MAG: glutaredoxin [Micropruina sp.]